MKKSNIYRAELSNRWSSRRRSPAVSRPQELTQSAPLTIIFLVISLVLTACSSAASTTPIPTVVLNNNNNPSNNQSNNGNAISASAVVVPVKDARLSFPASGRVTTVHVQVGDVVKKGQVLVELDTSILESKVKE